MDVVCKNCGHSVEEHAASCGCWHTEKNPARICACVLFPVKIYQIHISEQQARLDTNRTQVVALVSERDALQKMFDRERDDYTELKKKLERVEAMHFALKDAVRYARDMTLSETIRQAMIIALERDKNYE